MKNKKCSCCGISQPESNFHKKSSSKDGLSGHCKDCKKIKDKEWREKNKEYIRKKDKAYYEKNREVILDQYKEKYRSNRIQILSNLKEKRKDPEWRQRKSISDKKWREKNPDHLRKYFRDRHRIKSKTDPSFRLTAKIRKNMRRVAYGLQGKHIVRPSSLKALGCTIDEFKLHIESQWESWMNWENYGPGLYNQWQLDHIKPIKYFVQHSNNPFAANHYTNIRPLRGIDNLKKSSHY